MWEVNLTYNNKAANSAKKRWDSIAKPLNSLGELENTIVNIAGLIGSASIDI